MRVRDVSDSTHKVLKRRPATAEQSLQEYVRALLEEHAATSTVADVLQRVRQRSGSQATGEDIDLVVRDDRRMPLPTSRSRRPSTCRC